MNPVLLVLGIVATWVTMIVLASLLAVIPFFFVGLAGELLERHWRRAEKRQKHTREAAGFTEYEMWLESQRSHASLFESPGERHRKAA